MAQLQLRFLLTFLLLSGISVIHAQDEAPIIVQPAISPDGNTLAFSFQGDLWTVPVDGGRALRLTIHEAYDGSPAWSMDGAHLAFSSDRFGNADVFTIPSRGGMPNRLTFHSTGDRVSGWTNDGRILFATNRAFRQVEWSSEIYSVSMDGETPSRFLDATGYMPAMSPDGNFLAFAMGPCRTSREAYRGPANKDIWLYNLGTKTFTQLTDDEGNDYMPKWGSDGALYFLSAATGVYNIHKLAIDGNGKASGSPQKLTDYKEYGPAYLDVSTKGSKLVFERMGKMYTLPTLGGTPKMVSIEMATDYRFDPVERKTYSGDISSYSIAPNGKYTAIEVHGDVFVKETDKEESRTVNLSKHPFRDRFATYLNDSAVVFASDREGQYEFYLARSSDADQPNIFKSLKHEIIRLTNTDEDETAPVISPDGKKIAFMRGFAYGEGDFIVADIDENGDITNEVTMIEGWQTPQGVAWSPDSRWLAYALDDLNFNSEVYIRDAANEMTPVNVSMHPRNDYSPVWSPDGTKIGFVSDRNNGDSDVWFAWLREEDWEKTKQDWEEEKDEEENGDKKEDKDKKEEPDPVEIDFEDIHYRLQQVTSMPGGESQAMISKDGETFYFVAGSPTDDGRDLYSVKWDGKDIEQITKGGQNPYGLQMDNKGETLYYLTRGKMNKLKGSSTESLPHSAKMVVDHRKENEQVFEEAVRVLTAGFYDPKFHGKDWKKLQRDYKPIALNASTNTDFQYFYNLMLGQLNASHMGLYGVNDPADTQRERTGLLGLEVVPSNYGVTIAKVVPDTPADREKSKLNVGETIVSVDGTPVNSSNSFYSLLVNSAEEKVLLEVRNSNGATREVIIRPTNSIRGELYDEWVDERKALTEEYSGGKLGYIHIQGMNWPSFERFERELTAAGYGKDGIVIDVRYNGGGWTTDYLMAVLNVKQHAYTIPRGATDDLEKENANFVNNYPYGERLPLAAWTKPSVALCNQNSYSNAEIFSHAYKTLGIGTLVGYPTFGAVISTGGYSLMNGSYVRMPFRAWYVKATGENMEHGPAEPDIILTNAPDSKAKGKDEQLKKAVETLLSEIGQ